MESFKAQAYNLLRDPKRRETDWIPKGRRRQQSRDNDADCTKRIDVDLNIQNPKSKIQKSQATNEPTKKVK